MISNTLKRIVFLLMGWDKLCTILNIVSKKINLIGIYNKILKNHDLIKDYLEQQSL